MPPIRLIILAAILPLLGCATTRTYHETGAPNFVLDLREANFSFLSHDYKLAVFEELPNCRRRDLGQHSIDSPLTNLSLPVGKEILVAFDFSSGFSVVVNQGFWIRIRLRENESLRLLFRQKDGSTQRSFYLKDPVTGKEHETDGLPGRDCRHMEVI